MKLGKLSLLLVSIAMIIPFGYLIFNLENKLGGILVFYGIPLFVLSSIITGIIALRKKQERGYAITALILAGICVLIIALTLFSMTAYYKNRF